MSRTSLFTIGYSGHTPESFVERLKDAGVETLVDVRERPLSRKPGFSKKSLKQFVEDNGIGYVHLRELGVPRELRDEFKKGWSRKEYLAAFRRYLRKRTDALKPLDELMHQSACCLMCLEHDVEECHRSIVAEMLAAKVSSEMKTIHL